MVVGYFLMASWLVTTLKKNDCREIPMCVFQQIYLRASPFIGLSGPAQHDPPTWRHQHLRCEIED